MSRAAVNFKFGTTGTLRNKEYEVVVYMTAGDEFPDEYEIPDPDHKGKTIVVQLDMESSIVDEEGVGDIPRKCVLELVADENPQELSKDQLMRLARVGPYAEGADLSTEVQSVFNEEDFRETLASLPRKTDVVAFASEFFDLDINPNMTREDMEEAVVTARTSQE